MAEELIPPFYEQVTYRTIELQKRKFRCEYCLTLGHAAQQGAMQDFAVRGMSKIIEDYVRYAATWNCPMLHRATIDTPKDWWEHLKERWFPKWALKKWPVRYEKYEIWEAFPEVAMPPDHARQTVLIYNSVLKVGPRVNVRQDLW